MVPDPSQTSNQNHHKESNGRLRIQYDSTHFSVFSKGTHLNNNVVSCKTNATRKGCLPCFSMSPTFFLDRCESNFLFLPGFNHAQNPKNRTENRDPSTMAETNGSINQTNQQNSTMQSLFQALDPISLILSQNSADSHQPVPLKLTTESYFMERGPRYIAYAELRERKLRMKMMRGQEEVEENEFKQTPPKKQVKFQAANLGKSRKGYSVLAQSVPDFSATLRKENRKPRQELTPPASKNVSKISNGVLSNSRGSKSANAGEKKNAGFLMARKSYASVEELKGLSFAAANAINGESRGNRVGGRAVGNGKPVLGNRLF